MDMRRLRRAPAGIVRRGRNLHHRYAETRFHSRLRLDPSAPPVLLSPHWDDAVFDCWGLMTAHSQLTVVNVFAGVPEPGRLTRWDRVTGAEESAARAHERMDEDFAALSLAGRRPIDLPLLEAEYRETGPPLALGHLDAALADAVGVVSHVYAPAALGPTATTACPGGMRCHCCAGGFPSPCTPTSPTAWCTAGPTGSTAARPIPIATSTPSGTACSWTCPS